MATIEGKVHIFA